MKPFQSKVSVQVRAVRDARWLISPSKKLFPSPAIPGTSWASPSLVDVPPFLPPGDTAVCLTSLKSAGFVPYLLPSSSSYPALWWVEHEEPKVCPYRGREGARGAAVVVLKHQWASLCNRLPDQSGLSLVPSRCPETEFFQIKKKKSSEVRLPDWEELDKNQSW